MKLRSLFSHAAGACALMSMALLAAADVPPSLPDAKSQVPVATHSTGEHELTRADLSAWLDGLAPYVIARGRIAGAVIVVVKDGQVLLQKGYGYADVEHERPVDPQRTLFRIGSISKLFTWTAVMQLADQGGIDLDRDVNAYLDFQIPPAFGKSITLRHLMTHTSGFADQIKGSISSNPADFRSLEQYVKTELPARIDAPGEVPAYSNYGAALAGYIVQRVAGEDFNAYLDRHVFEPLGMHRSTARQPVPESLINDVSRGYKTGSGAPWYFELIQAPMGGISATGADMGQFMIGHLRAQRGESRLLSSQAAHLLHDTASKPMPELNGVTLGFVINRDARRIIGHGGDTHVFHSDLKLFMQDDAGLFIAFNSTGANRAAHAALKGISEGFTQRYFPTPTQQLPAAMSAVEHGRQLAAAGPYERSRGRAESSLGQLSGLFGQQQVHVNGDGTITLAFATQLNGQPKRWREVRPYVWQEVGGAQRLAARIADGRVQALGTDALSGTNVLLPVAPTRASTWILPLMMTAVAVLALTVIHWPIAAFVRRRCPAALVAAPPRNVLARRLARAAALANLIFLAGWVLILVRAFGDFSRLNESLDPWLRVLHALGLLGVVGAAFAVWNAWLSFRSEHRYASRLWSLGVAASCLAVAWFAFAFDLITTSLHY